ncbi:MAG: hypothetical protein U0X39_15615 [Bacteroidales bacterium]
MRGNNGNENDNNKVLAEIVKLRVERAKTIGLSRSCLHRARTQDGKEP